VIQLTVLVAVQAHPAPAVTLKDPLPAAAATDAEFDDSEYEQVEEAVIAKGTAAPNCVPLSRMLAVQLPVGMPAMVSVTV
jgi:hypothetical protein